MKFLKNLLCAALAGLLVTAPSYAYDSVTHSKTPGDVEINGDIQLDGNDVLDSGGTTRLTVGASSTLTGNLTVTGTTSFTGNTAMSGNLAVAGTFASTGTATDLTYHQSYNRTSAQIKVTTPTAVGLQVFDTTLNLPIWSTGTARSDDWATAAGARPSGY